jgi:hypothetical protein
VPYSPSAGHAFRNDVRVRHVRVAMNRAIVVPDDIGLDHATGFS